MQCKYISALLIICLNAGVWATELPDLPDLSKVNLNDLQAQLPAELANNFTLDDAKHVMRQKCIEVTGDEAAGTKAYENIETGFGGLIECFTGIVNYTAIQEEIEQAKPHGELDLVFNKYCGKRPQALECVENFNEKLLPCLDADEQESKNVVMRIARSLLNFICHKGGDQIALFIAEKGPECFSSQKENLTKCAEDIFNNYKEGGGIDKLKNNKLPKLVLGEKQCVEMQALETCIVMHLEQCAEITPANIVDSMFRFIRNETICRNTPYITPAKHSISKNASENLSASGCLLLLLTLGLLHLLYNKHNVA